jgi:hypothetical protein
MYAASYGLRSARGSCGGDPNMRCGSAVGPACVDGRIGETMYGGTTVFVRQRALTARAGCLVRDEPDIHKETDYRYNGLAAKPGLCLHRASTRRR